MSSDPFGHPTPESSDHPSAANEPSAPPSTPSATPPAPAGPAGAYPPGLHPGPQPGGQHPGGQHPGQDPYGHAPYAPPPYGEQPPYGQASYAQYPPPPQYAQPGPYGQPGYGYPPAGTGTDGLAIGALVCGIAGLSVVPFFGSIVALVLGLMSLSRIRESGQEGRGMAIAGLVLGGIGIALGLLLIIGVIALISFSAPEIHGVRWSAI